MYSLSEISLDDEIIAGNIFRDETIRFKKIFRVDRWAGFVL